MSYFKSKEAVKAWDEYNGKSADLRESLIALKEEFGGNLIFRQDVNRVSFGGLSFDGTLPEHAHLWTKPVRRNGNIIRPRASIKGADDKALLKELKVKYAELLPSDTSVSLEPLYQSIGTSWGDIMFAGISWFKRGDYLYLKTTAKLGSDCVEIMGSEYELAKEADGE